MRHFIGRLKISASGGASTIYIRLVCFAVSHGRQLGQSLIGAPSIVSAAKMAKLRFVDTTAAVTSMIDSFPKQDGQIPSLFLDLEGDNLSREGTLSLVTILVYPQDVYLVDVTKLGRLAFTTHSSRGETLQDVLQSPNRIKVFFDIRHDSDALFGHFKVAVRGIHDLQLMELATRGSHKRHVNGLAKCIDRDSGLLPSVKSNWTAVKEKGKQLFLPENGGSYAVFDKRPLSDEIATYCVQDVTYLPVLWLAYARKISRSWWTKVEQETKTRVMRSQASNFNGKGQHMALAPSGWMHWRPIDSSKQFRGLPAGLTKVRLDLFTLVPSVEKVPRDSATKEGAASSSDSEKNRNNIPEGTTRSLADFFDTLHLVDEDIHHCYSEADDRPFGRSSDPFSSSYYSGYDYDNDDDFTACGSDCGWCGHCDY